MDYNEWLNTVQGSNYEDLSEEGIRRDIDPFYDKLSSGEEAGRTQAYGGLERGRETTEEAYGESFINRGLAGSGIFQKEQGKALEQLSRGFASQYGAYGDITGEEATRLTGVEDQSLLPYNLRKFNIEQNRKTDVLDETRYREGRSYAEFDRQFRLAQENQ